MGGGGIIVIIHLDADPRGGKPQFCQQFRQFLHRMLVGVLHEGIVIATNIVVAFHEHGAPRAKRVHRTAPPDRIAVMGQDHALKDIEGPAVIACQPRHIRRVGDKDRIQPAYLHLGTGLGDAAQIFAGREIRLESSHWLAFGWSFEAKAGLFRAATLYPNTGKPCRFPTKSVRHGLEAAGHPA